MDAAGASPEAGSVTLHPLNPEGTNSAVCPPLCTPMAVSTPVSQSVSEDVQVVVVVCPLPTTDPEMMTESGIGTQADEFGPTAPKRRSPPRG